MSLSGKIVRALSCLLACAAFWCAAATVPAMARDADSSQRDIRIVVADESDQTKRIVQALRSKYPSAQVNVDTSAPPAKKKKAMHIAVGPAALRALLGRDTEGVIFSIFVSSQAYRTIAQETAVQRHAGLSAIYADPSPSDQFRLISRLYKRRVPVAVLLTEKNSHLVPALTQAAAKANLELVTHHIVTEDNNLNRALSRIGSASALLALPDGSVFNGENIRNILVTTYRSNQALIGFSASMVKAGALATTYSSIDDVIAQLAEAIDEFDSSGRLPEPQYPKYFSVVINDNVARSLNIVVDDGARELSRKPGGKQ